MNWLSWPVPREEALAGSRIQKKRAIIWEDHQNIEQEKNAERKAFCDLAWHTGASQSDIASLEQSTSIGTATPFHLHTRTKTAPIVRIARGLSWAFRLFFVPRHSGPLATKKGKGPLDNFRLIARRSVLQDVKKCFPY